MNQQKLNDNSKIKVIWIDDEPSETIDNKFYDAGIDTKTFAKADDALDEFKRHKGSYQAVILDMEGADGSVVEFSKAVKEFTKLLVNDPVPLYVLTSYSQNDLQYKLAEGTIESFGLNENQFFNKSFHLEELIHKIKEDCNNDRTKLYLKYRSVFEALSNPELHNFLYKIVEYIEAKTNDHVGLFNSMRKIYEMTLYRFIDVMPTDYFYGVDNQGNYSNDSSLVKNNIIGYLCGKITEVGLKNVGVRGYISIRIKGDRVLPDFLEIVVRDLYKVLSIEDHYTPGKNWTDSESFRKTMPRYLESYALQLIDLITWVHEEIINSTKDRFSEEKGILDVTKTKKIDNLELTERLNRDEKIVLAKARPNPKNPNWPNISFEDNRWFDWPKNTDDKDKVCNKLEKDPREHTLKLVVKDKYQIVKIIEFLD
ncbi:MAG TPA: hypothetical protein PK563_11835 [Tenuifilaceae bacterium]|nr:hypothetical protein [Tenuifilaceae bacterium]